MSCVDVNSIGKTPCKFFSEMWIVFWHPNVDKYMRKYFVCTHSTTKSITQSSWNTD